jgi:uncharacterized protein YkwD
LILRPSLSHRLLIASFAFFLFSLPACNGTTAIDGSSQAFDSLDGGGLIPADPQVPPGNGGGDGSGDSNNSGVTLSLEESNFLTLINNYRAQNGLGTLTASVTLTQASQWMSADMASKDYFSHTDSLGRSPFTRMEDFGYTQSSYSGENIAAGNSTASATFTQWKNSPGHNANMLGSSYKAIGIGRVQGSGGYGWYWTTDFGSVVDKAI